MCIYSVVNYFSAPLMFVCAEISLGPSRGSLANAARVGKGLLEALRPSPAPLKSGTGLLGLPFHGAELLLKSFTSFLGP